VEVIYKEYLIACETETVVNVTERLKKRASSLTREVETINQLYGNVRVGIGQTRSATTQTSHTQHRPLVATTTTAIWL